ncbi:MAG: hypothetical protein EXX96DRAFT_566611 [Benjaminiella poitrasii]|nr:MAG: hypothetical protein EXX96DRAFT_566611 [Benjaminiella poitrasii]
MNSVHDSKDWQGGISHQAPLQTPPIAVDSASSSSSPKPSSRINNNSEYSSVTGYSNHHEHNPEPKQSATSTTQQPYSASTESNPNNRLSGMIAAHSQPGTPHPEDNNNSLAEASTDELSMFRQPSTSSPSLFGARNVVRGRASIFSTELSPYFSSTKPFDNLYASDQATLLTVRVQSKMDRGFFLADNDWTCYRRNYFQVSSVFSIHGFNHYYSLNEPRAFVKTTEDGLLQPVQRFLLGISARVANSDKEIEIIQHTPKRDKGPQYKPGPKPITPGGNLSMSSVASNQNIVSFERLQFKTATANNGKRRAAQQYYICMVDLFAETDRNQIIRVASCQSAPLVVRGRSPGHYADNQVRRPAYSPTSHPIPSTAGSNSNPITPHPTPPPMQSEPSRSLMFTSYPKSLNSQDAMMQQQHEYDQQQHSQQPTYSYYSSYSPYAAGMPPQPAPSHQLSSSSPITHPPLPSPYAHHSAPTSANGPVPTYAIHDTTNHHDPYANEIYHHNAPTADEPKLHHHPFMQSTLESPHHGYDWQRARYNSASSGSSSVPSPGAQPGEPQQNYFSHPGQQSDGRLYSPTTPTSYSSSVIQQSRKYNNSVLNKHQLS